MGKPGGMDSRHGNRELEFMLISRLLHRRTILNSRKQRLRYESDFRLPRVGSSSSEELVLTLQYVLKSGISLRWHLPSSSLDENRPASRRVENRSIEASRRLCFQIPFRRTSNVDEKNQRDAHFSRGK